MQDSLGQVSDINHLHYGRSPNCIGCDVVIIDATGLLEPFDESCQGPRVALRGSNPLEERAGHTASKSRGTLFKTNTGSFRL